MSVQQQFLFADPGGEIRYSVRKSPRAKHVRLCVSPHEGLEVIIP